MSSFVGGTLSSGDVVSVEEWECEPVMYSSILMYMFDFIPYFLYNEIDCITFWFTLVDFSKIYIYYVHSSYKLNYIAIYKLYFMFIRDFNISQEEEYR